MRCSRVQQLYEDYTSDELPPATIARVEEHLAGCPACRQAFEENDRTAEVLRQAGEVAHPGLAYFDAMTDRVLDRLERTEAGSTIERRVAREPGPPRAWKRPLWWSGAFAAAALVLMGFLPDAAGPSRNDVAMDPSPGPSSTFSPMPAPFDGPSARPDVKIVEVSDQTRLEFSFGPVQSPATYDWIPRALAKLQAVGGTMLHKSVTDQGVADGTQSERLEAGPSRPYADRSQAEVASLNQPQRRMTRETERRIERLQKDFEKSDTLPEEILNQLELIKAQMSVGGGKELRKNLLDLESLVNRRMSDESQYRSLPIARHAKLYLRAEDALAAGDPDEAFTYLWRILNDDEESGLTIRAGLHLGDLCYGEWADFEQARSYYKRCQGFRARQALTSPERDHVKNQLMRLDRHAEGGWQALHMMHVIQRADWSQVVSAWRSLLALERTGPLLPEAAATIVARLEGPGQVPAENIAEICSLLANRSAIEHNAEIRAWLDLALGDILLSQYQDAPRAVERYRRVVEAARGSEAARVAQLKCDQLIERQLSHSVTH